MTELINLLFLIQIINQHFQFLFFLIILLILLLLFYLNLYRDNKLDLLYKVLGHGTRDLSTFEEGTKIDTLIGLGNGFDINKAKKPLLIGGGIGIAPLFGLCEAFNKMGIKPTLVFGARSANDIVLLEELEKLANVIVCTDDGTLGFKGNVIECIKNNNIDFDYYYACGPHKMLEFLAKAYPNGCLSLEARMGCGFGACMGCSIETTKKLSGVLTPPKFIFSL